MKVCVVNASNPEGPGNDSYVNFQNYNTWEDGKWRSWHSLACAEKSEFFPYNGENFNNVYKYNGIILLVNDNPHLLIPFIKKLKLMKKKVFVAYHEGGDDLLLKLSSPYYFKRLKETIKEADGYWTVIPEFNDFLTTAFDVKVVSCVHAIPYDEWNHGYTVPKQNREGILIATRTFNQRIRRNTIVSLITANEIAKNLKTKFTFVCEDDVDSNTLVDSYGLENVDILKPMNYNDWLKLIARHRLVVQFDNSYTLGQIVCDSALVDVPCMGGNTSNGSIINSGLDITLFTERFDNILKTIYKYPKSSDYLKSLTSFQAISKNIQENFKSLA